MSNLRTSEISKRTATFEIYFYFDCFFFSVLFLIVVDWLDETFIPTNQKRLRNAHQMACDALHEVGIPVLPGECGLYIWVDFREV